eukprot:g864.t1
MSAASDFLSFSCKRTERVELKRPISKYVGRTYGNEQATDISADIDEVCRRRTEVVAVSGGGTSDTAKDIYASYYRALSAMETRFPISRDSEHAQVSFCWTSASVARRRTKQINIHFEKASVLFNIAAISSQKGAVQNREDQQGYKSAIQYFQEAAGAFSFAREVALKVDNPKPSDLTPDYLTFAEKLMLAQGQECVFWRAMKDHKSPSTLSKVAKYASLLYSEALNLLIKPIVKDELDRTWQDLIQSKSWLFEALCQYNAAEDARANDEIAVEISRLNQSLMLLQKLQKSGKYLTTALPAFVKELIGVITQRLQLAEKDNASIYLKKVPPFNQLPGIDGVQIVKIVLPSAALDASKEHLFGELIPESVTKALSRYSEIVDRLIRQETEKLNGATDEARLKLRQYELPEVLDAVSLTNSALIPESLRKDLEDIDEAKGLIYINEMNEQIGALRDNAMTELNEIEQILNRESAEDSGLREQYGETWTAPTSASQTTEFRRLIVSYRGNLEAAKNSDKVIQEKLAQNTEKLTGLTVQQVLATIPRLEAGIISLGDVEPTMLVANIRDCLTQLNSISDERASLDEALKDMKNKDNLLSKLSATGVGSYDELFSMELDKYNPLKEEVNENLHKQKQLLDYLTEVYSIFQQSYDIASWKQQVDKFCKDLKSNITAFYDVRDNVGEGMRFYMNLKDAIDKVKQQTNDFAMSRKFDREDRLELIRAKEKQKQMETITPTLPPIHSYPGSSAGFTPPPPPPLEHQSAPLSHGGPPGGVQGYQDHMVNTASLYPSAPPLGYPTEQFVGAPGQYQPTYQPVNQPVNQQPVQSGYYQQEPGVHVQQYVQHQGYNPQQQNYPYVGNAPPPPPPPPPPPTESYYSPPNYGHPHYINNQNEQYCFAFNGVFNAEATQEEVFEGVASTVIEGALTGYNGTVFAYGQTGSGKTFTITGGPERYIDRGIIPRAISMIFSEITKRTDHSYSVHVSYLEIYNDVVYDLLDPDREVKDIDDLPRVIMRENEDSNLSLINLRICKVQSEEDALGLLGEDTVRRSKLNLVDLAGSERIKKTGVDGETQTESRYINLSLHYLEQVIVALQEFNQGVNRSHVPYRNSAMTLLLRDSLGGNCKTVMIANISIEEKQLDESISTCRFAQRVAMISNKAVVNEELDPLLVIARLKKEIVDLKEEIKFLRGDESHQIEPSEEQREAFRTELEQYCSSVSAVLDLNKSIHLIKYGFEVMREFAKNNRNQLISYRDDKKNNRSEENLEEDLTSVSCPTHDRVKETQKTKVELSASQKRELVSDYLKICKTLVS